MGQVTSGSSSTTSMSLKMRMKRAALPGEVDTRSSSLNQRCCSAVPPGMNCVVKNWRKAGFSCPQPSSASRAISSASSRISAPRLRLRRPLA
ncbi:hypothetical protein D3C86_1633290 [compost metagenome]